MKLPTLTPKIPSLPPHGEVSVNLKTLAREIAPDDPHDAVVATFAPPHLRSDAIVEQVLKFGDLHTKGLDDLIEAAENEIEALKADAQAIRDLYVKHTNRVVEDIKRLQNEVKLSMNLMRELRKQCDLLDANAAAKPGNYDD